MTKISRTQETLNLPIDEDNSNNTKTDRNGQKAQLGGLGANKNVDKKCPQKVFKKSVHLKCPQKMSTKSVHKKRKGSGSERKGSGR